MIKVNVECDSIKISGHANYDDFGKDIVCASVSSITITTINAISSLDSDAITCEESEGLLIINIIKHTNNVDTLIDNMINLLKELEQKYEKNIKITIK